MSFIEFVVYALAVWRISSLLVNEDGPAEVFERLRHAVGVRYNNLSERVATNELAKLFNCVWCASVWVSFAIVGLWGIAPELLFIFSLPFALSTIAIVIQETLDG